MWVSLWFEWCDAFPFGVTMLNGHLNSWPYM